LVANIAIQRWQCKQKLDFVFCNELPQNATKLLL